MADPQTNWIEYAAGRRWDPASGQVQYNQNGKWLSSGAPDVLYNRQSGQPYNPAQPNTPYNLLRGSGAGGPTADDFRQIYMMQQINAAQQQPQQPAGLAAQPLTAQSYFGPGGINSLGSTAPGRGGPGPGGINSLGSTAGGLGGTAAGQSDPLADAIARTRVQNQLLA